MQKKVFPVLFATLLLDMIGIGMIIPIIPIIFTDPSSHSFLLTNYSKTEQFLMAGALTALFGLMQFIAAPILGELSDVYGRKKLLLTGVVGLAISQLLFGFGIEISSLTLLFVSRAFAGIASANFSIAQAAIADVTEPKDRAKNFGLIGAAFGIGFILGPTLGGFIAKAAENAAAPFWFAGILGIINAFLVIFFLRETHHDRQAEHHFHIFKGIQNIRTALRDVDARPVYISSFLYTSGFTFFTSFIGILLVSRFSLSEAAIGTFFGAVGIWSVITQLFILHILAGRYSERAILRFSILGVALALFIYPFIPSMPLIYILIRSSLSLKASLWPIWVPSSAKASPPRNKEPRSVSMAHSWPSHKALYRSWLALDPVWQVSASLSLLELAVRSLLGLISSFSITIPTKSITPLSS